MNLSKVLYILVVSTLAFSCKKSFLDIENNTFLTRQSYVNNLATMKEFCNGIYLDYAKSFAFGEVVAYPEIIADNLKPVTLQGGVLSFHYAWKQVPDNDSQEYPGANPESTSINGVWLMGYRMIRSCNFVIEDIDKYRSENPKLADDILGQAYGMRALIHFWLVNYYAQHFSFTSDGSHIGIPYVETSDISQSYRRQTVAEVYQNIIDDYKKAIELLPATSDDTRNLNRNAIAALLCRTYLFKEDFNEAKQLGFEIAGKAPLMTLEAGYPEDLFKLKNSMETEVLFQLSPTPFPDFTAFLGLQVGSWSGLYATDDIADLLAQHPNDVRKSWIGGSPGSRTVVKFPANAAPEAGDIPFLEGAYYHCIIRSSEMFLTVAEAAARLGDEGTAQQYLYEVIHRSDSTAGLITESGNQLLELIYNERRKELCFEQLRMFDLQRWKKGVQRIDAPLDYAKDLPYPSNRAIAPIPIPDVQLMGIPQNIDY